MATTTRSKTATPSSRDSKSRLSRSVSEVNPRSGSKASSSAASPTSSSSRTPKRPLPRTKIQALESFVKFGLNGKEKEKPPEFPPKEWFDKPTASHSASSNSVPTVMRSSSPAPADSNIDNVLEETWSQSGAPDIARRMNTVKTISPAETAAAQVQHVTAAAERRSVSAPETPGIEEPPSPPEPMTLARRIQAMLSRAPPPPPTTSDATSGTEDAAPSVPAPPAPPIPAADRSLVDMLTNASIMNGKTAGQGVFAMLERLRKRPSSGPSDATDSTAESSDTKGNTEEPSRKDEEDDDDDSGVMFYGPLEPDEMSEVEIARSDVMSTYDDGETIEFERPAQRLSMARSPGPSPLALPQETVPSTDSTEKGKGKGKDGSATPTAQESAGEVGDKDASGKDRDGKTWFGTLRSRIVDGSKTVSENVSQGTDYVSAASRDAITKLTAPRPPTDREPVRTRVRWMPSPDKISFQATWWGYRLYLPPPVLDVLNNKRLEAAKRAAIVTTALQWMLGHVPVALVPPQFRPGLILAQRLVPYLGYVGAFVAWSWGAMKSFDKGYGIVLTATWVLPIALIPGTWETNEVISAPPRSPPIDDDVTISGSAGASSTAVNSRPSASLLSRGSANSGTTLVPSASGNVAGM
ncbi:hypothetical protein PENSPDRAFT_655648 [Peniophora sp. CONT]|nr:hypothetical protein PENSPDRAFT_655648 [Peniophora sp. CONT]